MHGVDGFMYPNEVRLYWSVMIVLYPYITGLVAGAFILASLERVFRVEAVKPTYRLALLTALAFLLVAPLPLPLHLTTQNSLFRSSQLAFLFLRPRLRCQSFASLPLDACQSGVIPVIVLSSVYRGTF